MHSQHIRFKEGDPEQHVVLPAPHPHPQLPPQIGPIATVWFLCFQTPVFALTDKEYSHSQTLR